LAGVGIDVYSVVTSSQPLRQSVKVISGWTAGWYLSGEFAAGGAEFGLAAGGPVGSAVLGTAGCMVGFFIGYSAASAAAGNVYDWADGTIFTKVPGISKP
jgi:hypothetical protein